MGHETHTHSFMCEFVRHILTHSCVSCDWRMSDMHHSDFMTMNGAWDTFESHISHITYESCYIYEWVMPHISESWHTYQGVMSHMNELWMGHVTHMNEWHKCIYMYIMSHLFIRGHVLMRDMSDSIIGSWVTWIMQSFRCVTWLIRMCDMTHSCVCYDSWIFVTWLIHKGQWLIHKWHDPCICVTWLMHMCNMTPSYVSHDSFMFMT